MRGKQVFVGVLLAMALSWPAAVVEPAAAAPAADPPPVATSLPVSTFAPVPGLQLRAIDPNTGWLYADDATANVLRVYQPDGTPVADLPRTDGRPIMGPVFSSGAAFFVRSGAVERYDPVSLAKTGTWTYTPTGWFPSSVFALDDAVWWQEWPVQDGPRSNYLFATATEQVSYVGREQLDGVSGAGGVTAEVSWSRDTGESSLTIRTAIDSWDSLRLPYDRLGDLAVASDGSGGVAVHPAASVLREFAISPEGQLSETGVTFPFDGTVVSSSVGPSPARAVVVETKVGDAPSMLTVYRGGNTDPVAQVPAFGSAPIGFSPDGSKAYRNRNGAIEVIDLAPVLGAPTPGLVGQAGGATISIPYEGVAPAGAAIGGVAAPSTVGPGELSAVVPADLPVGSVPIEVTGRLGSVQETPVPLQVVELGPYGTVGPFVQRQYADVLGRAATSGEVDAAVADLAGGDLAGQLPAALVRSRPLSAKDAALIRLYQAVFRRLPDTAGYRYWLGRLEGGTTLVKAAATFAGSSEFQRTYGSLANGPFIDLVYQNVLGRAPDPTGRAYWLRKLGAGTSRGTLVAQFSQSSEYVRKTTDRVERVRLVLAMFDRMPSQGELDFVGALSLDQVAQALLTAAQYPAS